MAENGGMPERRIQPVATDQERRDLNRRLRLAFLQGAMAADDGPILPSGEHGLHEAELAQGPLERVELVVADPAGVRGVRAQQVERDLLEGQRGKAAGEAPALRSTAALSRDVRLTMRNRTDRWVSTALAFSPRPSKTPRTRRPATSVHERSA
jgi:hypothetical protein